MGNYIIIKDSDILQDFIEWLPELHDGEAYYCGLYARKKYCTDMTYVSSDKRQLARFSTTKNFLYERIKQLECETGWYCQNHLSVPQEALALYITINPRSYERATRDLLLKLTSYVTKPYCWFNPYQEAMSAIHKCYSRKLFIDFDFDGADLIQVRNSLWDKINSDCLHFLMTRGGFHLLVERSKIQNQYRNTWYKAVIALAGIDSKGNHNMIPVPGCYQGGFTPYFLK